MTIMERELLSAPQTVKACYEANIEAVTAIAKEVKARGIDGVITGARGTSHHAAIVFKFYTELLAGLSTAHFYPSVSNMYGAKLCYGKKLFVAVSQSGGSPDTLKMLQSAKANGALTVAVTNVADSVLSTAADFSLFLAAGEEKAVAATKTFTTELTALLMLAQALGGKQVIDIENLTVKLNDVAGRIDDVALLSKALVQAPAVIALSRGTTQGLANELGLKIIETCYKYTIASSTNEFCHGPQALVASGTPVVLLAPNGEGRDSYVEAANRLKGQGAFLLAITDIDEVKAAADLTFAMPAVDAFEAPIVYAVAIQALACRLSVALGLNPDAPRNLNKVTITN